VADPAHRFSGVLSPVVTPFAIDLSPDASRLAAQCRWLLAQSVGLAVFGTNSEANSLSVDEKCALLDALIEDDIPAERLMPGTGCCALTDTVRLTRHAVELGCGGVLMLPPFYYKDVTDEGLFRSYAEVVERVADDRLNIYLYHIPPVARVGISIDLIDRLLEAFPGTVVGIKDSSGDWENTRAMLERDWDDFHIFVGSESLLLENMRHGGAGCISATANVNPGAIHALYAGWRAGTADKQQSALDALRAIVQSFPMIPALKAIVARYSGDSAWRTVRPPLVALDDDQAGALYARLDDIGFDMPGLG
jgi:4-hydroxy-tetrahydrodipicolinate synthase